MTGIGSPGGDGVVQPACVHRPRVHPNNAFVRFEKAEVEQSIPARFATLALRNADRVAVKTRNQTITYGQLDAAADRVAVAILAVRGHG